MALSEKLAKKFAKLLNKAGLEDDKVNEIVGEIEEALTEEDAQDGNNPAPEEPKAPEVEEEQKSEEPKPEEPAAEDGDNPVVPNGEVPPQPEVPPAPDGSIESVLSQFNPEVPPQEPVATPNPEGEVPPAPSDALEVQKLRNDIEELKKANKGWEARVNSLEDALKKAGILEGESNVGDETPVPLPDAPNGQGVILDEVLKTINGK